MSAPLLASRDPLGQRSDSLSNGWEIHDHSCGCVGTLHAMALRRSRVEIFCLSPNTLHAVWNIVVRKNINRSATVRRRLRVPFGPRFCGDSRLQRKLHSRKKLRQPGSTKTFPNFLFEPFFAPWRSPVGGRHLTALCTYSVTQRTHEMASMALGAQPLDVIRLV